MVGMHFLCKEIASNIRRTYLLPAESKRQGSKGFPKA
jgi:hypothetical protein